MTQEELQLLLDAALQGATDKRERHGRYRLVAKALCHNQLRDRALIEYVDRAAAAEDIVLEYAMNTTAPTEPRTDWPPLDRCDVVYRDWRIQFVPHHNGASAIAVGFSPQGRSDDLIHAGTILAEGIVNPEWRAKLAASIQADIDKKFNGTWTPPQGQ